MTATKRALVLIADGSEEIESVTPIDVLARGKVEVTVATLHEGGELVVKCSRGVHLKADTSLANSKVTAENFDALVLPGGNDGAHAFKESAQVQTLLAAFEKGDKVVAIICASPIALLTNNAFAGRRITSHPAVKSLLEDHYEYDDRSRVVVDGKLITSRGPGTALDFALTILAQLLGRESAEKVAAPMLIPEGTVIVG